MKQNLNIEAEGQELMKNNNIQVEAEGGELIIRNGSSDYVIIPKKYRLEVQDMIKDGCHGCIDKLVETLPAMEDYAQNGSVYPTDDKGNSTRKETFTQWGERIKKLAPNLDYIKDDGTYNYRGAYEGGLEPEFVKEDNSYHLGSRNPITGEILKSEKHPSFKVSVEEDMKRGYETYRGTDGKIYSHDKNYLDKNKDKVKEYLGIYEGGILPEVKITAEAPTYIKYKQAWGKENPFDIDKYVENRFNNPVGREAISRINERAWRENLRQEGLKKRQAELDEATKMGLLYQRFNPQRRDDIFIADEQFQKRYGTSPHRYRYDNDPEYKKYYEQQARNATSKIDYPSTDLRRKDVVDPNNMWMYSNLTGESKKRMTNFSNEVIGMALPIPVLETMGKIPSVFKAGKNLIKPVSKVVGKTDDAIKAGSKVLNKEEALSKLSNESKINLSETFNNLADKSKNISENVMYELNTLHKKLNPSYQKRAKKELKYANKWQEKWYNHPETMKRLQSLSDEFNTYRNQVIDEINKINKSLRENPDNLKLGYTQEELNYIYRDIPYRTENDWTKIIGRINDKNYTSTFQSKDAKLQKILKGEVRTHKGNQGVSGHYLDKDYSGARQNLVDKYSPKIKSTAIHEGNHGLTEGNRLIPKSEQEEMVKIFGKDKKIPVRNEHGEFNTYDEYLEDPTEIYARIMELREYMGVKPGEHVSADAIEKLIQSGKNGDTPVDSYFFSKIQDKEILKKLFNRLPAITPVIGISYLQSQQQNKTEQ